MTPSSMRFTARTPVDLLAVVPYVIGFHPEDSVVVLTFGGPGESFHARVDLPLVVEDQRDVAAMLREVILRNDARTVGLLLYTEDAAAALAFHDRLVPGLLADGIEVVDSLRVAGDRFHAADDLDDPGVAYDLTSHPFTATQVLHGRVVHDSRAALADTLVGGDEGDTTDIAAAADAFADRLMSVGSRARRGRGGARPSLERALGSELVGQVRWLQRRLRELTVAARPDEIAALGPAEAGRILVLLALESVRDTVAAELTRANAPHQLALWRSLVRRAPHDLRPGPASLCALAAWLHGEGALAWCALERCFEADPDDALGQHVAALLESATPPSVWSPTARGLSEERSRV